MKRRRRRTPARTRPRRFAGHRGRDPGDGGGNVDRLGDGGCALRVAMPRMPRHPAGVAARRSRMRRQISPRNHPWARLTAWRSTPVRTRRGPSPGGPAHFCARDPSGGKPMIEALQQWIDSRMNGRASSAAACGTRRHQRLPQRGRNVSALKNTTDAGQSHNSSRNCSRVCPPRAGAPPSEQGNIWCVVRPDGWLLGLVVCLDSEAEQQLDKTCEAFSGTALECSDGTTVRAGSK